MIKALVLALLVPTLVVGQTPVVQSIIDSAAREGLPTRPLVEKALEGSAKHAPPDAIANAVRALAGALAGARSALGPASPDELNAGAVALRLGARPEDLTRLRAARSGGNLVVPLGVLSDLVARGVPVDTASKVVVALASNGDDVYLAFRQRVDRDIDLGAAPIGSVIGALNSSGRSALQSPGKKP